MTDPGQQWHRSVQFTYWLQWQLHRQLAAASEYAAAKHVALKGDLPIGARACVCRVCGFVGAEAGVRWAGVGAVQQAPSRSAGASSHPALLRCAAALLLCCTADLYRGAGAGVDKCSVDTWLWPNNFHMQASTGE